MLTAKKQIFTIILLLLVASILLSCEKSNSNNDPKTIEDLLIKDKEIIGWTYFGAGWVAYNITEIMKQIDGAIVVYQRYSNDIEAAYQAYDGTVNNTRCQLRLYIYDMGDSAYAKGVYNDPDIGLSGAIDWQGGAGTAAHYVRNNGLSQMLSFYNKSYFVLLDIGVDTEESLNILKQFALNVDGKIRFP